MSRVRKSENKPIEFKWRNVFYLTFFALFVISGVFITAKLREVKYFPIKQVEVFGVSHADHAEVQRILLSLVNDGFFAVDVDQVKDSLQQSPWIAKAIVQRTWPDKIIVTIEEKNAVARWNDSSLIGNRGEIFSPPQTSYPDGLPLFVGAEGQQVQILTYYNKINNLFSPLHFKISRLELTPSNFWNLTFNNGMKLTMGNKDILTHISHFVKVYPKIVGTRAGEIDYIDLRYPNGLAVRWKTVT